MPLSDAPKIDCHCHILDPAGFPYNPDARFHPSGAEIGTAAQIGHVFAAHGVRHALLVQPNSGYEGDNRCMLSAIAGSEGRYRGIAVVPRDIALDALAELKAAGIIGVAFNLPFHGVDYYRDTAPLIGKLVELGMFLQLQVFEQQLVEFLPVLGQSPVRLLFDHCGRPDVARGLDQPGFQALLALGRARRAIVKLSGFYKFSRQSHPFADTLPFVEALVDAFTTEACVWGSDWPFLRAPERLDYGPLVGLMEKVFASDEERSRIFWETPKRQFGF